MKWNLLLKENFELLQTFEGWSLVLFGCLIGFLIFQLIHWSERRTLEDGQKLLDEQKKNFEKENNEILDIKDESKRLKDCNKVLNQNIERLHKVNEVSKKKIVSLELKDSKKEISEFAVIILKKCKDHDINKFHDRIMSKEVSLSLLEYEVGLEELKENQFICQEGASLDSSCYYKMTQEGRKYILGLNIK